MDLGRRLLLWVLFSHFILELICVVKGNVLFEVQHRYGGRHRGLAALREMKAHDARRHGRKLGGVDFQLGGDGSPVSTALYYTKVTIGTPPAEYHLQVDTGSDLLWVNCKDCENCAKKTDLKITLRQYDIEASSTSKTISCDQDFCSMVFNNAPISNCKAGAKCPYALGYGDGSKTTGFFVKDNFKFDQVTGNRRVSPMNGTIGFGCSSKQSGDLESSQQAVDGIIGFGPSNTSVLAQLASAGKVKKVFSHCLDGTKGGGIFAIGQVADPKVNSTPLVGDSTHYNIAFKGMEIGGKAVELPKALFGLLPQTRSAIIDSGSTLTYLPSDIYKVVMERIMAQHGDIKLYSVDNTYKCFSYKGKVDDGFPTINFQFDKSVSLMAYPHDYMFQLQNGDYCLGWLLTIIEKDGQEAFLFGDNLLSNKLVVYDLENRSVGWADHQCSTSIKVKDEKTGHVYEVGSHKLSGSSDLRANYISFLLFIASILYLIV